MKATEEIDRLLCKIQDGDMPPDEPVFVLRARDLLAAGAVTCWAQTARALDVPIERINEAMALAEKMRQWPVKQVPGRPETRVRTTKVKETNDG